MNDRFNKQNVVITGAGSGLGRASAIRLASEGASLCLIDLDERGLEETARLVSALNKQGLKVLNIVADVSRESEVEAAVKKAVEEFEVLHCFFNNAGVEGPQNLTEEYPAEEFGRILDVNLNGVFYGLKHVLSVMKKQGFGSIVNTSSVGGIRGVGNQAAYAASKHGVVGLTRNSGIEYGVFGININAIAPGAIMTPMVESSLKKMAGEDWQAAGEEFVSHNPMRRFGKPEEVAALVAFLLSEDASFINATVINIDGGQSYKY